MIPTSQILVKSAIYQPLDETWRMVDTLKGGTQAMRAAGQTYLPKAPKEADDDYIRRINMSVLTNFYMQAVKTTTNMIVSNGVETENTSPVTEDFFTNVDAKSSSLKEFVRDTLQSAIHYGVSYALVDFTATDPALVQPWDRPYWIRVEAPNMIALETQMIEGVETITHIRFQEVASTQYQSGMGTMSYSSQVVQQVRSYYLVETDSGFQVVYEIYQQNDRNWELVRTGVQAGVDRIPIVPFYGNKLGYCIGEPLYKDLAELNVRHWQSYSDQSNLLHYASCPILFGKGLDEVDSNGQPVQIQIGANTVLRTQRADADLKFVEHNGNAIRSGSDDIDRLEDAMTMFGPSLLVNTGGGQTATEWVLRASALNANLNEIAEKAETSLGLLMAYTLPYLGETTFPYITITPQILNIRDSKSQPENQVNTMTTTGSTSLNTAATANEQMNQ